MTRVKAAINGGRAHPAPITPDEIANDARAVIAAGAFAVHVHPRDADGRESLEPDDVAAVVKVAGKIGVTTGAWIASNRVELLSRWSVLPQFASVNMHEDDAVEVARLLSARGVAIEAGLINAAAAETFIKSRVRCIRILIEPQEQTVADALATVDAIEAVIRSSGLPRVLHGFDATAWPLVEEAARRGFDTRIGFEDTLVLPDGSPAKSNAQLIETARRVIAREHD